MNNNLPVLCLALLLTCLIRVTSSYRDWGNHAPLTQSTLGADPASVFDAAWREGSQREPRSKPRVLIRNIEENEEKKREALSPSDNIEGRNMSSRKSSDELKSKAKAPNPIAPKTHGRNELSEFLEWRPKKYERLEVSDLLKVMAMREMEDNNVYNTRQDLGNEEVRTGSGSKALKNEFLDIFQDFINDELDSKKKLVKKFSKALSKNTSVLQYAAIGLTCGFVLYHILSYVKTQQIVTPMYTGAAYRYRSFGEGPTAVQAVSFILNKVFSFHELVEKLQAKTN